MMRAPVLRASPGEDTLRPPRSRLRTNLVSRSAHCSAPRGGASPLERLESRIVMAADLVVSELMYQASSRSEADEWIELYNRGTTPANLAGWKLTKGVDYTFGDRTVGLGEYVVVAADVGRFRAKYPGVGNVVGGWVGRLANSQEEIQLEDAGGSVVDSVTYADQGDWAKRRRGPLDNGHRGWEWVQPASGGGHTLELVNPALTNNEGQNWEASTVEQGTPGAANSVASGNIAPMILDVAHFPLVPRSSDTVTVTAKLLDEASTGHSVTLFRRIDGDSSFTSVTMFDDGSNGDAFANDRVWTASIGSRADKDIVEYYVRAQDSGGRTRTWP